MARKTKAELLNGIINPNSVKMLKNNTIEYFKLDGTRVIRHFSTDILIFHKDKSITFDNGGYDSMTTKERINEFQNIIGVYQQDHVWYYMTRGKDGLWDRDNVHKFYNGMRLKANGKRY